MNNKQYVIQTNCTEMVSLRKKVNNNPILWINKNKTNQSKSDHKEHMIQTWKRKQSEKCICVQKY